MSVHLEPASQLSFRRPLTQITKESLLVTNPNNDPVMFKIKTTAPKQYCVRPNAGRVEPNSHVEVHVILQPFKEEPPADYKCKDKFLVQTTIIKPAYEALPIADMWSRVEQEDKGSIFQQKIKCVYLPPKEDPYLVNATSEQEPVQAAPQPPSPVVPEPVVPEPVVPEPVVPEPVVPAPSAPAPAPPVFEPEIVEKEQPTSPEAVVPTSPAVVEQVSVENNVSSPPITHTQSISVDQAPEPKARSVPAPAPIEVKSEQPEEKAPAPIETFVKPEPQEEKAPAPVEPVVVAAPTVSSPVSPKVTSKTMTPVVEEDKEKKKLQDDLKKANDMIQQLQKQVATIQKEQEAKGGSKKLPSTVQPQDAVHQHLAALEKNQATEGYPPQVVLIVAALTFVFTYLFF